MSNKAQTQYRDLPKGKKVQVLSPDGFTIEQTPIKYKSFEAAEAAFNVWKERYKAQGYYSSVRGRIPLDELIDHCSVNIV